MNPFTTTNRRHVRQGSRVMTIAIGALIFLVGLICGAAIGIAGSVTGMEGY